MKEAASNPAIRISLIYLFFAGLWILLSDRILDGMVNNVHVLSQIQTYKGWAFVIASAGLIYFLLAREILHRDQAEE